MGRNQKKEVDEARRKREMGENLGIKGQKEEGGRRKGSRRSL